VSVVRLKKMIQMNQLDPNNPSNRHLLELLSQSKEVESQTLVRMDPLYETILIGDHIVISVKNNTVSSPRWVGTQYLTRPANQRHKMLIARQANPAAFAGGNKVWPETAIPLREDEIDGTDDRREEFWDRIYAPEFPEAADDETKVDNKKVQKLMHFKQKIQDQVRKAKAKQGGQQRRAYRLEDVVHQPALPAFHAPNIMAAVKNIFRKRSALRPQQGKLKQTSASPTSCKISVTIQRAHNLPTRRVEPGPGGKMEEAPPLECLVQASYGSERARTPVVTGNSPAWNARIDLELVPPNKNWSPSNLMKITDSLSLNVFDSKIHEKPGTDGSVKKLEKRWLGSITFPFSTIYTATANGRIDGVFELDAPPHVIGYSHQGAADSRGSLQVCVALDPPLAQPSERDAETKGRLPGEAGLDERIHSWIAECSRPAHCHHRTYEALGRSLHRDWVLATRYITPQAAPQGAYTPGEKLEVLMDQLARYVALVPFMEDWNMQEGGQEVDVEGLDVWTTSAELIDIGAGDWEEHATLLCNFFLSLFALQNAKEKKKAYVVWGVGIPEGNTVYCMTMDDPPPGEEPEVFLWNASKGSHFSAKNHRCTLKEVYCIADATNVWGNIQATKEIRSTSFKLGDRKAWKPLFDAKNPSDTFMMDTVQGEIDWKPNQKNDAFVEETTKYIRVAVRNRLEHWRSREGKSMVDNEGANRKLTEILKKMEASAHKELAFSEEDLHTDFAQYLQPGNPTSGFNMTGFYINRAFTDISPILDEIYNADIHHAGPVSGDTGERDTQFAHAVFVKAYPRRVLSLWVGVACLSKKR